MRCKCKSKKKQEIYAGFQKGAKDKVTNVTNEDRNIKQFSGFLYKSKECNLKPDVSPSIEPENNSKFRHPTEPDNTKTHINIKYNFIQTLERDEF